MENNNLDNYRDVLMKLGAAMISLYEGKELIEEQINLIKSVSDKTKILAMEMYVSSSLKGKKYTNFCYNVRRLKIK